MHRAKVLLRGFAFFRRRDGLDLRMMVVLSATIRLRAMTVRLHHYSYILTLAAMLTTLSFSVSATVSRQIAKNVRLLFRYAYYTYEDQTSGNHNNYEGHSFFTSLQYRF
jgi:hypothetical protein